MAGSAGTAFVDLEPRFGGGWTSAVTAEARRAGSAGSQILGGFATKTGGLFQSLDRQLAGFGVPLTGQLSTIGTHLQGLSSAEGEAASGAARLGQVGTAAFLGIGAAAAGLGVISAKAFLEGQDATVGYQQALKNVGGSEEELHPKLEKTVSLLAKYGEENDAVEISAAKLTRATKDGGKALDDVVLAADIAAGRRIDLASATNLLVKVETGHVALLGRLGINTKDATGKTITQEEAIKRLTDLYGGSAAAQAKTYAGELRALGAEAHNLEEELGGKIVPAVANFGKGLLDGVHAIEAVNSASHGWLGTLAVTGLAAGGVLVAVNKVSSGLQSLGGWLQTATGLTVAQTEAETAEAAATASVAEAHIATAAAAVAGGFILGKTAGDAINKVLGGAKPNVDDLASSFTDLAKTQQLGGSAAVDLGDHLQGLSGDLKTVEGNALQKGFGFAPSAHNAVKDIGAVNEALSQVLATKGPDAAAKAFGQVASMLEQDGVSAQTLGAQFKPFLNDLDAATAKAQATAGASKELGETFDELATKQLSHESAQLSIADSFDQVTAAEDDLKKARDNAAGTGDEAIAAARQETNARAGLTSAIESQAQAATTLGEANAKLAEFNGTTDTRIRVLERENITSRVVTTPEEARQKEIDLLQFDEGNADKKTQLQKQVADAEHGVEEATKRVGDAETGVEDAVKARAKVQTDANAAVEAGERKVKEAVIAVATEVQKASAAGTINNKQLRVYLTLLDQIAKTADPNGPLAKNLDGIILRMSIARGGTSAAHTGAGIGDPSVFAIPTPAATTEPTTVATNGRQTGPSPTEGLGGVTINQENHFHGRDVPDTQELDVLNKKSAIRISTAITSRH